MECISKTVCIHSPFRLVCMCPYSRLKSNATTLHGTIAHIVIKIEMIMTRCGAIIACAIATNSTWAVELPIFARMDWVVLVSSRLQRPCCNWSQVTVYTYDLPLCSATLCHLHYIGQVLLRHGHAHTPTSFYRLFFIFIPRKLFYIKQKLRTMKQYNTAFAE